jgi:hypothetical protein
LCFISPKDLQGCDQIGAETRIEPEQAHMFIKEIDDYGIIALAPKSVKLPDSGAVINIPQTYPRQRERVRCKIFWKVREIKNNPAKPNPAYGAVHRATGEQM